MLRCPACRSYTLGGKCPKCGSVAESPHPAKFSFEDKYAKYRRKAKFG
ncbi:nucleolar RNA-binding Nop10p family protein [Candidatus Micrarchaeota archaeon]|nr:nucleolar RNA-binding Nop10p family protein [Candidatus Micrarchaeota archaeon]MBI5177535.1 nucleolar RNA-binding Nop10p family protein [Candidatus Micrarchaeota archaeon]